MKCHLYIYDHHDKSSVYRQSFMSKIIYKIRTKCPTKLGLIPIIMSNQKIYDHLSSDPTQDEWQERKSWHQPPIEIVTPNPVVLPPRIIASPLVGPLQLPQVLVELTSPSFSGPHGGSSQSLLGSFYISSVIPVSRNTIRSHWSNICVNNFVSICLIKNIFSSFILKIKS